jgi:hypothetical protein
MDTAEGRLQEWWDSLTPDQRERLLAADLDLPLPDDLVDVVTRAKVFGPTVMSWWEQQPEATTWHATWRVREFVAAKRHE